MPEIPKLEQPAQTNSIEPQDIIITRARQPEGSFRWHSFYSGKAAQDKFSVAFFFVIFRVAIGYARMRSASITSLVLVLL